MSTAGAHRARRTTRNLGRALAATAVAVGLTSAGTGTLWTLNATPVNQVEAGAVPAGSSAPSVSPASAEGTGQREPAVSRTAGSVPAPRRSVPVAAPPHRLRLPGVSAPIVPVAADQRRQLAIPDDPDRVGWWVGGAAPGAPAGTVVLAGHVDSATAGRGVLFDLPRIALDTVVTLDTAAGARSYRVVARRSVPKQQLPADLFAAGGAPRLALITCGGAFRDGSYERNVIVYAVPV